jgi:hypothetical protein
MVPTDLRSHPEIAFRTLRHPVHAVVAERSRIAGAMQEMRKPAGSRIEAIQPTRIRGDPDNGVGILVQREYRDR